MDVTRRDFIKISGAAAAGLMLGSLLDLKPIKAHATANPPVWTSTVTSICCYCAVGCGLLVSVDSTTTPTDIYVQGDPDHPINQGALCSKGAGMAQLRLVNNALNPKRLTQPMVRRPGSSSWTTLTWDQALGEITTHIKTTRDGTDINGSDLDGVDNTITEVDIGGTLYPANRCRAIACLGGAAHDTEECYLLVKLTRALGLVYIEHQARI